ncbi:hypothetical protein GCK72_025476 [Caenorhabditis remanei]|uniref:Uncharacterized protein n=1 Tax=Caenorhabditis remanei TaxID=31234 RepID=A0A6A5G380_CAERE|nr:hypothetical protein GCK72_025476 [Caenorhabditis remanei]KAF1749009.1 hypothetical protein GCK72_025476 [Caenorhabditis remanei]
MSGKSNADIRSSNVPLGNQRRNASSFANFFTVVTTVVILFRPPKLVLCQVSLHKAASDGAPITGYISRWPFYQGHL